MTTETTPQETVVENMENDCILVPGTNAGTTRLTFEFCVVDIGVPQTINSVTVEPTMHYSGAPVYPGEPNELPNTGASGVLVILAIVTTTSGFLLKKIARRAHV